MARRDTGTDLIHQEQSSFEIQKVVPLLINNIRLQLIRNGNNNLDVPYIPVLKGRPGIAKTAHIKLIAKELNLTLLYVSIGAKPTEFLSGLPLTSNIVFENEKDRDKGYVFWSSSELVHLANEIAAKNNTNGCLIFLDDMHIADPGIQKYMFELLLERKLGNYQLANNVAMVGAMNSSTQAGFDGYFSAVINRIQMFNVYMKWKYWYENCGADMHPIVAAFVRHHGDAGDVLEEDERQDRPFATFRSWSQISMMMDYPYKQYLQTKDMATLLEQTFMLGTSYVSPETALILKNETMQILKYDYEGMVKNNAYKINFDDPISQYSFGNIIRYLRDNKDVDNLVKYIKLLMDTQEENKYSNAVMNIMYELSSMSNVYNKKNTEEAKVALARIQYMQKQLFKEGKGIIHRMMADINNMPYDN